MDFTTTTDEKNSGRLSPLSCRKCGSFWRQQRPTNLRTTALSLTLLCLLPFTVATASGTAEPPSGRTVNATSTAHDASSPPSSAPWTDTDVTADAAQRELRRDSPPVSGPGDEPDSSSDRSFRRHSTVAATPLLPAGSGTAEPEQVPDHWQSVAGRIRQQLLVDARRNDVDSLCHRHTELFLKEVEKLQPWALQMLDASSKLPSGLLQGNKDWWGSYSECVDVSVRLNRTTSASAAPADFDGQYCTVSVQLDAFTTRASKDTQAVLERLGLLDGASASAGPPAAALSVSVGVCVPSTCSENETQITVQAILDSLKLPATATTSSCQSKHTYQLDTPAYAVLCVWGVFTLLIFLGTSYEVSKSLLSSCRCGSKTKTSDGHATSMDPLAAHCVSSEALNQHGKVGRFLLCFSAISNMKQILNVGQTQAEHMSTLHGVRFLSMSWIILGHTYFVGMISGPLWDNGKDFLSLPANFAFQGVLRGIFSVDTFLFLSGLLVVYVTMKKMKATDGKFNVFSFYLHRLIRILPVYMMAIAWVAGPSNYVLAGGPMWPQMTQAKRYCQETWWKNLLFISNFGDTTKMCIQHSWYISLDTQLYAITPLLLYPMYKYPRLGVLLTVLCIVASCTTAGIISYTLGLPSSSLLHTVPVETLIAYAKEFYIKPYCRMGPYAVGMLFGYLLLNADLKTRIKPPVAYLLWFLAIVSNLSILYGTYGQFVVETAPSVLQSAIYNALSGTVWTLAIGWLVSACVIGHGGIVNTILSWKVWVPLSRLTYCAYLLHMIVQYTFFDSRQNKFHFDHLLMVTLFAGFMLVTYGVALIFSVAFEAPIIRLEKLVTSGEEKKPTKNGSTNL